MTVDLTPEAVEGLAERLTQTDKTKHGYYGYVAFNRDGKEAASTLRALSARLAELEAERDSAVRGRNDWRDDYKALSSAIVGDTGLSAMTVATQARLYRPRAEAAEAAIATARANALREAAEVCTRIIKDYDVMKADGVTYEPIKVQKAAKGMVSLARQDILALIPQEKPHE
jgi:hypothetical protein